VERAKSNVLAVIRSIAGSKGGKRRLVTMTTEERRAQGVKAGRASAKARRKKAEARKLAARKGA
jgi:hypothetical protein